MMDANAHAVFDHAVEADVEERVEPTMGASSIRIRHPNECLPYRPPRRPKWEPTRDRRDAGSPQRRRDEGFLSPTIVAAANLGAVRINFRYGGWVAASAMHSEKAQRDQFFEGSNEPWGCRLHEIETDTLDLQYQAITIVYRTRKGETRHTTLDFGVETSGGRIAFGEDKASSEYFEEPGTYERLDHVERLLATMGVGLERRVAGGIRNELHRSVVKEIFDNRRTHFEEHEAGSVVALIRAAGGTAPLGDVLRSLDHPVETALAMVHAMMRHRHVAVPLNRPAMLDTPVTIPVAAKKSALRAFLAEHVPAEAERE